MMVVAAKECKCPCNPFLESNQAELNNKSDAVAAAVVDSVAACQTAAVASFDYV